MLMRMVEMVMTIMKVIMMLMKNNGNNDDDDDDDDEGSDDGGEDDNLRMMMMKLVMMMNVVMIKPNGMVRVYKDPSAHKDVVTSHTLTKLNQHNYVHKMHGLLELEEMTRHAIVSRYNLACNVTITQFVDEKGAFFIGQNGDLFMKVTLAEALTSDSLAGQLFISNVQTALLAHTESTSKKVYEARLVHQGNYEYDGRGKDYVYLVVNAEAAKALCVSPGQNVQLEVQFQMDRTLFCRMHYALDSLSSTQIAFPDLLKFKADVQLLKNMASIGSTFLNEEQLIAVRHIVVQRNGYIPPLIMYGPFGTGKTQTLASATKALLFAQKDQVRILICTQSNSAADLYITKHLHTFFKENSGFKILRLNAEIRKINTVPPEVLKFCLCMNNMFAIPPKEQMMHYQLVLTTVENASILSSLQMHGVFTHIFIDEAGQ
ncbi:helicase with Zinc finger domain 2, partial [Plakobranchus ocellatus]